MPHDIQNIIDKIIVVQKTITKPADEKAIATYYDEQPVSVPIFPAFVNVDEAIDQQVEWNTGGRRVDYLIAMHLVFALSDQKYSDRTRRTWTRPVLDAFGKKITLSGATGVAKAIIQGAEFGRITIGEAEYWGSTFRLGVIVEEAFEWAV